MILKETTPFVGMTYFLYIIKVYINFFFMQKYFIEIAHMNFPPHAFCRQEILIFSYNQNQKLYIYIFPIYVNLHSREEKLTCVVNSLFLDCVFRHKYVDSRNDFFFLLKYFTIQSLNSFFNLFILHYVGGDLGLMIWFVVLMLNFISKKLFEKNNLSRTKRQQWNGFVQCTKHAFQLFFTKFIFGCFSFII